MKLYIYCLFIGFLVIMSCQQDTIEPFMGDPDDRLEAKLTEYKDKLIGSPYGWKGYLYPGEGGGYNFFFEFTSEGTVSMVSDINDESASVMQTSLYRMEAPQRPSLYFDTYSYLHMLSDPDPEVNGGILGHGYLSDFEFSFVESIGDTIKLTGNQHQSEFILVRATQRENEHYKAGRLKTIKHEVADYTKAHPYLFMLAPDNKKTSVSLNPFMRSFSLIETVEGEVIVNTSRFSYTTQGILLHDQLHYRDMVFKEVMADTASNRLYIEDKVQGRIDLMAFEEPVFPMHQMVGIEFLTITLSPDPVNSPGWSSTFRSNWIAMDDALAECCNLRLSDIQLIFNAQQKLMDVNIYIKDVSVNRSYRLRYPYTYLKTYDGVFKFMTSVDEEPNFNAQYFKPIMDLMLDEIANRSYRMDYLKTENGFVGQMRSQDSPGFYFAGELR